MTLGPLAFAVLAWGAVGLVVAVFAYEAYAVVRELGPGWGGRDG